MHETRYELELIWYLDPFTSYVWCDIVLINVTSSMAKRWRLKYSSWKWKVNSTHLYFTPPLCVCVCVCVFLWRFDPMPVHDLPLQDFPITHTSIGHITLDRIPLDEWSARRRDFYLTTHNIHERPTPVPPGGIRTRNPPPQQASGRRPTP
jgi:hypothetical protein